MIDEALAAIGRPNTHVRLIVGGVSDDEDEEEAEDEEEERPTPARARWTARDTDLPSTDVFILEGEQLRYGSREAWSARR